MTSAAPEPDLQQEPSFFAGLLSYLLPGLGQIYQGRFGKGILFMTSLLGLFFLGLAMGNWRNVYMPDVEVGPQGGGLRRPLVSLYNRWHFAGQFWIGMAAWPAIWQFYDMPMPTEEADPFWHNFMRTPDEHELNDFLMRSDKTPDLGWVYTVIAGMLNILVIYDAFAGPAYGPSRPTRPEETPPDASGGTEVTP